MRISYLGDEGSFTYLAAVEKFGRENHFLPTFTIARVFEAVRRNEADWGVIPFENSTRGMIYDTVDELVSEEFSSSGILIYEEIVAKIALSLLSRASLPQIKKVYSHHSPLSNCRQWLRKNLPQAEIISVESTSEAAKRASEEDLSSAIASRESAKIHNLEIIVPEIDSGTENITTFFVIGKKPHPPTGEDKTSIAFSLEHKPGALYRALGVFARAEVNLTRIISRPLEKKRGEYIFFVELEGHESGEKLKKTLQRLRKYVASMNIISSYPMAKTGLE
jgi:chorismate mutase/prephenate dehydratase